MFCIFDDDAKGFLEDDFGRSCSISYRSFILPSGGDFDGDTRSLGDYVIYMFYNGGYLFVGVCAPNVHFMMYDLRLRYTKSVGLPIDAVDLDDTVVGLFWKYAFDCMDKCRDGTSCINSNNGIEGARISELWKWTSLFFFEDKCERVEGSFEPVTFCSWSDCSCTRLAKPSYFCFNFVAYCCERRCCSNEFMYSIFRSIVSMYFLSSCGQGGNGFSAESFRHR